MNMIGGLRLLRACSSISVVGAITLALISPMKVAAQTSNAAHGYPSKPINFIVPFAAGSNGDLVTRLVSHKLATALGQPIVIDNRPGAGGNLGAELAARSAPDGYTIMLTAPAHAVNVSLYTKRRYDLLKDFVPVAFLTTSPQALIVHPSVKARTLGEFLALAKSQPGDLMYGSSGNGSAAHMAMELLQLETGIRLLHVPYKGGGEATKDLVGGQIQVMFNAPSTALEYVRTNKVRALAVSSAKRSPLAPELPTLAESGVAGYETLIWQGVLAPVGTPPAIVERLNAEINKALAAPDLKKEFTVLGVEPFPSTQKQFQEYLHTEVVKWSRVVKATGAKVE